MTITASAVLALREAAPQIGVDVETLKFWLRTGLIVGVPRRGGGVGIPEDEVHRVRRRLGFPN